MKQTNRGRERNMRVKNGQSISYCPILIIKDGTINAKKRE